MSEGVYKFKKNADKVVVLNENDFDTATGNLINEKLNHGYTTVMVYADWCGHCRTAKPIYANISNMTCCQTRSSALDSDKYKELIDKLNHSHASKQGMVIRGYPTFIQFKNGKFYRIYEAPSSDGNRLLNFVVGTKQY